MRRIWGRTHDLIMEYICCEPDDTWHYLAVPVTGEKILNFNLRDAKLVPRNSAIRKVKMWSFPISDEESEEEEIKVEVYTGEESVEVEIVAELLEEKL